MAYFDELVLLTNFIVFLTSGKCWKANVSDFNLDVVIMLDQSSSMGVTNVKDVHRDLKTWMESYLDTYGAESSRFSLINCCDTNVTSTIPRNDTPPIVMHYFNEKNVAQNIPFLLANATYDDGCNDNLDGCTNKSVDAMFIESKGHRNNATNVTLWVSDCESWWGKTGKYLGHIAAARRLYELVRSKVFMVCALSKGKRDKIDRYLNNTLAFLKESHQGNESIIIYESGAQLDKRINQVLPKREVEVKDCEITEDFSECEFQTSSGDCKERYMYYIQQQPFPKHLGKPCQPKYANETKIDCNCTLPFTLTQQIVIDEKDIAAIGSVVVGGLILIIVILVILATIVKQRRKKRLLHAQANTVVKKCEQKCIEADMTMCVGPPIAIDRSQLAKPFKTSVDKTSSVRLSTSEKQVKSAPVKTSGSKLPTIKVSVSKTIKKSAHQ